MRTARTRVPMEWSRRDEATGDHDLYGIAAFCLIGLLLFLNFIFRFPDVGAIIEQYNLF